MLRVAFVCACGALWLVAARIMTCCPGCACQRRAGPDVADVEISLRHPALVRVLRRRFFRRLFRVDQIYLQLVRGSWRTYPPPPAPVLIAWARERYGHMPFSRFDRRDAVGTYAPRLVVDDAVGRRRLSADHIAIGRRSRTGRPWK